MPHLVPVVIPVRRHGRPWHDLVTKHSENLAPGHHGMTELGGRQLGAKWTREEMFSKHPHFPRTVTEILGKSVCVRTGSATAPKIVKNSGNGNTQNGMQDKLGLIVK